MYINEQHKKSSIDFKTYDGPSCDQIIVRLGKGCNFKCIFCNVSDNEKKIKDKELYIDIISKLLYKIKNSPAKKGDMVNFTISGGEPLLFKKEFYFTIKYIILLCSKKGLIPNFDFQTNASISDTVFYDKIYKLGVKKVLISFHSIQKNSFKKLMGIDFNNLKFIVNGINVINNSGIEVSLNIIINKINYLEFDDIIKYTINNFPFIEKYYIGFIQPHGNAYNNINDLFIDYTKIDYYYNKGIFLIIKNKKIVSSHYVGLPACFIIKKKVSLEVRENINFRKNYSFDSRYFINKVNDLNKIYKKECNKCLYNNICSGIWKEYIDIQSINPVSYSKIFINKYHVYSIILDHYYDYKSLKKIFSSNKKHILIKNTFPFYNIKEMVKNAIEIGFYKISLIIESVYDNSLLYSGITNYQLEIENLDLVFFDLIYNFNNSGYGPQFNISFDIYIKELNELAERKLEYILLNKKNNFINIYINRKYINIFNKNKYNENNIKYI